MRHNLMINSKTWINKSVIHCIFRWQPCKCLRWTVSNVLVKLERHSVITILQLVFGNRLVVCITSLGCYTSHSRITTKIHLKPLAKIVSERWPSASLGMQPGLYCGVVSIQLGRRAYLVIRDWLPFHAKRCYTSYDWNGRPIAFVNLKVIVVILLVILQLEGLRRLAGLKHRSFYPIKVFFKLLSIRRTALISS